MTTPARKTVTTNLRIPVAIHEQLSSYAHQTAGSINSAAIAAMDKGLKELGFPGLVIDPALVPEKD